MNSTRECPPKGCKWVKEQKETTRNVSARASVPKMWSDRPLFNVGRCMSAHHSTGPYVGGVVTAASPGPGREPHVCVCAEQPVVPLVLPV